MQPDTSEVNRLLRPLGSWRQPQRRVVCFPYAGASSTVFNAWHHHLSPDVELRAVQLPARQDRLAEPPLTRMVNIVDQLVTALNRLPRLPTLLYGHSFGALVAFEVARKLEAQGEPALALMVGARGAPHRPSLHGQVHQLSEPEFLEAIHHRYGTPWSVLRDRELMLLALPPLRADFEAFETYRFESGLRLITPVTVLHGIRDASVDADDAAAWAEVACMPLRLHQVDAGHFFMDTHRSWVLERVAAVLAPIPRTSGQ